MIKLNKKDYNIILPLTKNIKHNKALIHSIIDGNTDGAILVDDEDNPTAAFIGWEFSFLLGKESDIIFSKDLFHYIFTSFVPSLNDKEIILFKSPEDWPYLDTLFEDKSCITIERMMFAFNKNKFDESRKSFKPLAENFTLSKITYTDENKIGFCIKDNSKVVSKCESVAIGNSEAEIDISTHEDYRGKGLATLTASAFINECIKKGITPIWSCWPERKGSISLAKRLGFEETEIVPVTLWAEDL